MGDCANLATCAFFQTYESDESKKLALQGFISRYCKGNEQENCVRKKVSRALGGPEKVPVNMMPNGVPLPGSDKSNWSPEVRQILTQVVTA
jgi:hypothetical protein